MQISSGNRCFQALNRIILPVAMMTITSISLAAQEVTLDWRIHDVGKVRQVVTNTGGINATADLNTGAGLHDYPGLFNTEYPPNSQEEHILEAGIRIGAIVNGDTLVSVSNRNNGHVANEFFPTAEPYDTIWTASPGQILNIPYWPNYEGVSEQDFILRYSDYNITNISRHRPLYVDVIQTSYAWASFPLDKVIVYNYYIIPTQVDLEAVYVSYLLQGRIGDLRLGSRAIDNDDLSRYYPEHNMAVLVDQPGGDGDAVSPLGIKIIPPNNQPDSVEWTFSWYRDHNPLPDRDWDYYEEISSHVIMPDQVTSGGPEALFQLSFGPIDLALGDTLHFIAIEILGEGLGEVLRTAERMDVLVEQDFKVPVAPPSPPLRGEIRSHEVTLRWDPLAGDVDPEQYLDPNRGDKVLRPFEGYRIYKSTVSTTGPWSLLAEYDLADNSIGYNTGLTYEFTDVGLLDNLEYYYSVTAYARADTVLEFNFLESGINRNVQTVIPGTSPPSKVGQVAVVPNPYRGDVNYNAFNPKWEKNPPGRPWLEQDRRIQFINLPAICDITIYTLTGDFVAKLHHDDPERGSEDWNLTSSVGQAISSGIYLFTVQAAGGGETQVGKFVIIK